MNLFFLVFQSQLSLQCVMLQEEMWKSWGAKKLLEEIKANNLRGCYSIFRIPSTCKKKNRHVKDIKNFYFLFFQKQLGPTYLNLVISNSLLFWTWKHFLFLPSSCFLSVISPLFWTILHFSWEFKITGSVVSHCKLHT